jgi:hypothetical protein
MMVAELVLFGLLSCLNHISEIAEVPLLIGKRRERTGAMIWRIALTRSRRGAANLLG